MATDSTLTTVPQKHDADQAGGEKEIVYSSDGGDPFRVTFPATLGSSIVGSAAAGAGAAGTTTVTAAATPTYGTPYLAASSTSLSDGDCLVSEGMSPEQAFEVFSGKLFPTKNSLSTIKQTIGSSSKSTEESPLQRLSRLQRELNEMREFVAATTATTAGGGGESGEQLAFEKQLKALQEQWTLLSAAHSRQQELLTATINSSVSGLTMTSSSLSLPTNMMAVETPSATTPTTTTTTTPPTTALIEERLKRLEIAIGSGSTTAAGVASSSAVAGATSGGCIVERLQKLEAMQSKLDEKQSDQLQKRAKVIRQDLEAAAKARNKLMSTSAASGGGIVEDSKTIAALYDQLQALSGMTDHLPVLAQRLQALAHQHASTASWDGRLRATESVTSRLETHLGSIERAIETMATSLEQNAKQMQLNIQALDQRIEKLHLNR